MARRFNKFGLRRDLNFADLASPQQSLNNVLNGLVDVTGETFITQDLDAFKDIGATTMTNDDFRNIAGAALKTTNTSGQLVTYKPVIKFKNRLDVAKFTIGEPNFYGGDGLTARYYESTQINASPSATFSDIFTGTEVQKEVFWERGIFNFISKINDKFKDIHGGVSWNGFFRPTVPGQWNFGISTSGFYTFEIDDGAGNLVLVSSKSQKDTNIVVSAATSGSEWITLTTTADIKKVLVNDVVIHATIPQFADTSSTNYATAVTVKEIDYVGGRVKIAPVLAANLPAATTLTFRHRIGDTSGSFSYTTVNLEQYKTYKIRYRFWIPNIAGLPSRLLKSITFTATPPGSQGSYIDYKWLYNEDYNINPTVGTASYGDFRVFYDSKLNASGGTIGSSTFATYQGVVTKAPLSISYNPPVSLAAITAQTKTVNLTAGSNIVPMPLTDGIAVGQYVSSNVFAVVPEGTRVKEVSINQGIFLTEPATQTGSSILTFIDHRGLIAQSTSIQTLIGNTSITLSTELYNAVSVGDVVIASNLPQYTLITSKNASNVVVLSDAPTSNGVVGARVVFYSPKGLSNNTLATFCNDVVSAPTVAQSNAGSNTLTVAYTDGIGVNDRPQFGTRIPSGTTVTAVNTGTKVVTLSANLTDDIPVNQLITFAPAGTTDNKEMCFPPIDTSPPFTSTALGLTTTSARPSINIAPLSGATGELKFVGLSADGVTVTATVPTAGYTRTLKIKDRLGTEYRILATTV